MIANPTKAGYTFTGWTPIVTTMPDYDVRFDAVFNQQISLTKIVASLNPYTHYVGSPIGMMTVIAYYSNGTYAPVTNYSYVGFDSSTIGLGNITVSYTESGITKTATVGYQVIKASDQTGFIRLYNEANRIRIEYDAHSNVKKLYIKYSPTEFYGTQALIATHIFGNASIPMIEIDSKDLLPLGNGSSRMWYVNTPQSGFYYVYGEDASNKTVGYEVIYRP